MNGHNCSVYRLINTPVRAALIACCLGAALPQATLAQGTQWIWSPEQTGRIPNGSCYFRKHFTATNPQRAQIVIGADDAYELFVNGRRIGTGNGWQTFDSYDVTGRLRRGDNVIAVKVNNTQGTTAALAARVTVKERGGTSVAHSTDGSWLTQRSPLAFWQNNRYVDTRWKQARVLGPVGRTQPWVLPPSPNDPSAPAAVGTPSPLAGPAPPAVKNDKNVLVEEGRFVIDREFFIEQLVQHEDCGSLITMSFNEFGDVIASREGGGLVLITDSNGDRIPDEVRSYCDAIKSCQGILPLNGDVYVTGDGPDGPALYKLVIEEGRLEVGQTLVKFSGGMGEHGVHNVILGADGFLYVLVGNHSSPQTPYASTSPHRDYYEGDLILPRYEDPGGHARGKKVPGGVVIRTDTKGSVVELVAGGLRNPYDMALNRWGELFTHDSDMEWDKGTSWYRPTRINHIIPGGEYGWRSGWAKWPETYVDSLPGVDDTGRGSPTGVVFYEHFMFPTRYHGAMFLCDWSQGKILVSNLKRDGAGYTATTETFVDGDPLNITDIDVGPDGALYFVTGGRDTHGGLYRISWRGRVPEKVTNLGNGVARAIRQPQLHSPWARQRIAEVKQRVGDEWNSYLLTLARTSKNPPRYRTRALDLMQLFGPDPPIELLLEISKDDSAEVRGRAADLMGLRDDPGIKSRLAEMLVDRDAMVRRRAAESLLRNRGDVPVSRVLRMLSSRDRHEAWAARRLIERVPTEHWQERVLTSSNRRLFIVGSLALLTAHPSAENAKTVVNRVQKFMRGFINDRDFRDMLRLVQVAMIRGELKADDVPGLGRQLAEEFPSTDNLLNRELIRLLTFLQVNDIQHRYLAHLRSGVSDVEKLDIALHIGHIRGGWSTKDRLELFKFYEKAQEFEGGTSLKGYVQAVSRTFAKDLSFQDRMEIIALGKDYPTAAMSAIFGLPRELDADTVAQLRRLDRTLVDEEGEAFDRLRIGLFAVMARRSDEESNRYLREVFDREPKRRDAVAMGLAQKPDGENWSYLVRSLAFLEGGAAQEILIKLQRSSKSPDDPKDIRNAILVGLKLGDEGGQHAVALLRHWTGEQLSQAQKPTEVLDAWRKWFSKTYPDEIAADLPVDAVDSKWSYEEILEHLGKDETKEKASAKAGASAFAKAQCIQCHVYGNQGERMGPDLTAITKRFQQREILQSIVYPSHVISDQYASKTLYLVDGKVLTGIVAPGAAGEVIVLSADGKKRAVREDDIDEMSPSKTSAMPANLLNELTLDEIADLFQFLKESPRVNFTRVPRR